MLDFEESKQNDRVESLRAKEAEDLAQMLSERYKIPYADLSKFSINTDALRLIPETVARAANAAAFRIVGKNIHLGVMSPQNRALGEILSDLETKNLVPTLYLVSETSLERAWSYYQEISLAQKTKGGIIDISGEDIQRFANELHAIEDIQHALDIETEEVRRSGVGVSTTLELVLAGAIKTEASDIHIEPEEAGVRLRYRLDGALHDIRDFNPKLYAQMLSRIKLISGLKLNVKQAAQDGRFSITWNGTEIEIRTSILPGAYGESIVLRLLNPETIKVSFGELGIEPQLMEIFKEEIHKPNGMILLTGPTGSGKTTTLYSFLREINNPESKIITIEDPIEYHLEGISQTQVNDEKGYTFLSGLRSALRQDPDIIMVGEIRDGETAATAINASLTGHLVFSTLHTNNAAGTIPRLIDLGVNPKIISSALRVSIAQRLVRKLCPLCKEAYVPEGKERARLEEILAALREKRPEAPATLPSALWRSAGCPRCNGTGFKGREGVFEAIIMDERIATLAMTNPSERDIKIAARAQRLLDMREDGVLKILAGVTSYDELGRVVDLTEEILRGDLTP